MMKNTQRSTNQKLGLSFFRLQHPIILVALMFGVFLCSFDLGRLIFLSQLENPQKEERLQSLTLWTGDFHSPSDKIIFSYISNNRRATFILFEEIFQALRTYSRPYIYLFFKKIIENLGENRKKWLFSAISLLNLTKIPGPPLVPDPTFIRF